MEVILGRGVRLTSFLGSSPIFVVKNFQESIRRVSCTGSTRWALNPSERYPHSRTLTCNYSPLLKHVKTQQKPFEHVNNNGISLAYYCDSKQVPKEDGQKTEAEKKVSVFQKMKQLTKDYWHILIPVHVVTSLGWTALFYIAVKNGIDIVKVMEALHLSERYLQILRNTSAGDWAMIYALYKLFTPLRYTVTVGGTTLAIKHLNRLGLLKASSFKPKRQANKTEVSKPSTTEHKAEFKPERHTDPPKT